MTPDLVLSCFKSETNEYLCKSRQRVSETLLVSNGGKYRIPEFLFMRLLNVFEQDAMSARWHRKEICNILGLDLVLLGLDPIGSFFEFYHCPTCAPVACSSALERIFYNLLFNLGMG